MTQGVLTSIFGSDADNFSERELAIADKVINWFCSPKSASEEITKSENELINACRYALLEEGVSWESVMLNRTRKKEIVGYRDAIISIVWERTYGTQSHKASLLGGMLTRSTILHAVNSASDWVKYDPSFKNLYDRITESIDFFLNTLQGK